LVEVELVHSKNNEKTGEPGETNQLVEKDCVVVVLQGVIERVIPLIEKDIDIDDPEVESDDGKHKPPQSSENQNGWVIAQASRRTWRRPVMVKGLGGFGHGAESFESKQRSGVCVATWMVS
jgi:hypothetical protein